MSGTRTSDLTAEEQAHVRVALRFLRARCGGWSNVAKVLRFDESTIRAAAGGRGTVSASMAVRTARFAKVGVGDLLEGRFPPPGTCPHCGRGPEAAGPAFQ
jgi:hypothetical protein